MSKQTSGFQDRGLKLKFLWAPHTIFFSAAAFEGMGRRTV